MGAYTLARRRGVTDDEVLDVLDRGFDLDQPAGRRGLTYVEMRSDGWSHQAAVDELAGWGLV